MRLALALLAAAACGGSPSSLASHFPLARLGDRALCDHLISRTDTVTVDGEPKLRRKLILGDLHLGAGAAPRDRRLAGLEDFHADAEFAALLEREAARGPLDLVIDGDFIEFWQIVTALGALPRPDDGRQPDGPVLGADQDAALAAVRLVIAAHAQVFRALGRLLEAGDHRVILVAGNHDADLLWPRVQLAIAEAIGPRDPRRLLFVPSPAYQHGGVYVAHGHTHDAANRFAAPAAPFGRDRDGRCRLMTSWGEVFVQIFYTETERQLPFIDNLYPERAAVLWALRDNPDLQRDLGALVRAVDLVVTAQNAKLNRDALGAILQNTFGLPGKTRGPSSAREVLDHVGDRLTQGDAGAAELLVALTQLLLDPALASLRAGLVDAARALPDLRAALGALGTVDPRALAWLHARLFGDPLETAAAHIVRERGVEVVVFGHTHTVGGLVRPLPRGGHYANTGSWIPVASVADLRRRRVPWESLSLADRATFPSKRTVVVVDYANGRPLPPVVENAPY